MKPVTLMIYGYNDKGMRIPLDSLTFHVDERGKGEVDASLLFEKLSYSARDQGWLLKKENRG